MRAICLSLLALFCLTQPAMAQIGVPAKLADTYQRDDRTGNLYAGATNAPHRVKVFIAVGCSGCRDYYLKSLSPLMEYLGVEQGKSRFDLMVDNLNIGGARSIAQTSYCLPAAAARNFLTTVFMHEDNYIVYDEKAGKWVFRDDFLPAVLTAIGLSPTEISNVRKCTVTYAADIDRIMAANYADLQRYPNSEGGVTVPTVVVDGVRLTADSKLPRF